MCLDKSLSYQIVVVISAVMYLIHNDTCRVHTDDCHNFTINFNEITANKLVNLRSRVDASCFKIMLMHATSLE